MPIDREDGRHWCAPEREQIPESGEWTCPGCSTKWLYTKVENSSDEHIGDFWETEKARAERLSLTSLDEMIEQMEEDTPLPDGGEK